MGWSMAMLSKAFLAIPTYLWIEFFPFVGASLKVLASGPSMAATEQTEKGWSYDIFGGVPQNTFLPSPSPSLVTLAHAGRIPFAVEFGVSSTTALPSANNMNILLLNFCAWLHISSMQEYEIVKCDKEYLLFVPWCPPLEYFNHAPMILGLFLEEGIRLCSNILGP